MKYEKIGYVSGESRVLYKLSKPFEYEDGCTCDYVVEDFAWTLDKGPETMLFPADEHGTIIDFGELWCMYEMALEKCIDEWIEHLNLLSNAKKNPSFEDRCFVGLKHYFLLEGIELISKDFNGFWVIRRMDDAGVKSVALCDVKYIKYEDGEEYHDVDHHVSRKHFERNAFKFLMEHEGTVDSDMSLKFDTISLHVISNRGLIVHCKGAMLEDDNE